MLLSIRLKKIAPSIAALAAIGVGASSAAAAPTASPIRIAASAPKIVEFGSRVGINGSIRPAAAGVYVVLQQRSGSRWVNVRGRKTTARGEFLFVLRLRKTGGYAFRVVTSAKDKKHRGASQVVRVNVLEWESLTDRSPVDMSETRYVDDGAFDVNGKTYEKFVAIRPFSSFLFCHNQDAWLEYNLGRK